MLTSKPKNTTSEGILNYIIDEKDDYVENYEEISATYSPDISLETQAILNCCELLNSNYKPTLNKKIADIGCGAGFVINSLDAFEKVAVDISLNQLKRVDPSITRIRANVENLPIQDKYFDVVVCTDIFEHVQDEKALVKEVSRILKPGGMLLFACPWEQDLSVYDLPEYKAKFKQYKYVHLRSVNEFIIDENFSSFEKISSCLLYTSPSPRDKRQSRMPSSA